MEELVELRRLDAEHRFAAVDEPFAFHVDGHAQRGGGGALPDAGLEHEESALLDGELDVAHVAVVVLESLHGVEELLVAFREGGGHGVEGFGDADAGDDVFALGVAEEVAVGPVLAGGGVAGERDPGAGVVAFVAEDHGLDVDGGAEIVGDAFELAVVAGASAVPGSEHGFDGVAELLLGFLGELVLGGVFDDALEGLDELGEVVGAQLGVGFDPAGAAEAFEHGLEVFAGDVEDDLAEHLHEPAVRVVREALVVGLLGEALDGRVVETEVQDGVHHPRHGERGTGADRDQEGVVVGAEALAHLGFELAETGRDFVEEPVGEGVFVGHVHLAGFGGDGEAGRDRKTELGHLGEVGALAAE